MTDRIPPILARRGHVPEVPGAGSAGAGPIPIPPSKSVFRFPADHYAHLEAPTEWWWHTGALTAGDRVFGFEINAASFRGMLGMSFTQIMLADVKNKRHYQEFKIYGYDKNWAEHDPAKPWRVELGDAKSYARMRAPQATPTQHMEVQALLADKATSVRFELEFSQKGAPFIVWGTGVQPEGGHGGHFERYNYYYSLTGLRASGKIYLEGEHAETHTVSGLTWMDHEYGHFGSKAKPVQWILQHIQLDNGASISNSYVIQTDKTPPDPPPKLGQRSKSVATVQQDGEMYFVRSFVTPTGRTWPSPVSGKEYFMELRVEIPAFDAEITVTSLMDSQEFPLPAPAYEGIASAVGTFQGKTVSGSAWNEQAT